MGSIITLSALFQLVCSQYFFGDSLFANSMNSDATHTINCKQYETIYGMSINCSRMNMTSLPLKKYTEEYFYADFSGNNFQELNKTTFHIRDNNALTFIWFLYLNNSNISSITDDVFNNIIGIIFRLDLSNNRLTRIPFLGEQELKYLFLQHNRIEVVEAKSLRGLTNLRSLNLSYCKIYKVESGAFDELNKIPRTLLLNNNRLLKLAIPMDKLNEIRWLEEFDISNNIFDCDCYNYELAKFIIGKEEGTNCKDCNMKYGNTGCLLQLYDSFCAPAKNVTLIRSSDQPKMAICNINTNNNSGNSTQISFYKIDDEGNSHEIKKNLPAIPLHKITNDSGNSRIGHNYKLENIDSCKFCRIYCVAKNDSRIGSSNILFTDKYSQFTSQLYSHLLDECKSLCINCHLTNVPEINFYYCKSGGNIINLSFNDFQYLAKNIFANRIKEGNSNVVQKLILRNCHISEIHNGAFNRMSNLRLLDLNGNALTTITAKSFLPIHQLQVLDLGGNQLEELCSHSFMKLKKLNILNLTSCAISHISTRTFIPLKNTLVELHMGDNSLENVTFLGSIWKNLNILDLSRNPLEHLPFAFSNLVALKYLDLSSCKTFTTIPKNTFHGLKQLKTLNLSSNKVQEIEINAFASLTNIVELKLNDNSLKELSVQVFNGLSTNQTHIDLEENMFQCTCHNLNLSLWLRSNPNVASNMINDCFQEFSQMRCEHQILRMNQIDNRNIECEVKAETGHTEITWFWDNLPIPATNSLITSIIKNKKPDEENIFISTLKFTPIDLTYMGSKLKCVAQNEVGEKAEQSEEVNIIITNEEETY